MTPLLGAIRFEILPLAHTPAAAAAALPPGATVTVTCSPRRGLEATLSVAEQLAAAGFHAVPHLAARQMPDEVALKETIVRLEHAGIDEVFVIGGDAPAPAGPYADALALLRDMTDLGARFGRVGVAAYPGGHPHIDDTALLDALRAKQPLASYLVTQLCFDAQAILRWLRQARRAGIHLPAYVGLPGVVSRTKLLRTALRIGVADARRYAAANRSSATRLLADGAISPDALATALAAELAAGDRVAGTHLYTFDELDAAARWVAAQDQPPTQRGESTPERG